jgi:uncharacterized membrane protein
MLTDLVLIVAGVLTALMAGLFFAFSVAVTWGLGRLKDSDYLKANQSINRAILNPIFLLSFIGPVVLLPVATFLSIGDSTKFPLLCAASFLYIIGVFGVTMRGNVPLNNQLDRFVIEHASEKKLDEARAAYENPWNRLNTIRTVANILALIFVLLAK